MGATETLGVQSYASVDALRIGMVRNAVKLFEKHGLFSGAWTIEEPSAELASVPRPPLEFAESAGDESNDSTYECESEESSSLDTESELLDSWRVAEVPPLHDVCQCRCHCGQYDCDECYEDVSEDALALSLSAMPPTVAPVVGTPPPSAAPMLPSVAPQAGPLFATQAGPLVAPHGGPWVAPQGCGALIELPEEQDDYTTIYLYDESFPAEKQCQRGLVLQWTSDGALKLEHRSQRESSYLMFWTQTYSQSQLLGTLVAVPTRIEQL
jgi:hypothetical protein